MDQNAANSTCLYTTGAGADCPKGIMRKQHPYMQDTTFHRKKRSKPLHHHGQCRRQQVCSSSSSIHGLENVGIIPSQVSGGHGRTLSSPVLRSICSFMCIPFVRYFFMRSSKNPTDRRRICLHLSCGCVYAQQPPPGGRAAWMPS